mmetsp:Transcript_35663/g.34696  ORF Transcript_35663/g.34696 Transcript_35663/m.34696 type:complete len:98 (+) Transcript_35663:44-337(+)
MIGQGGSLSLRESHSDVKNMFLRNLRENQDIDQNYLKNFNQLKEERNYSRGESPKKYMTKRNKHSLTNSDQARLKSKQANDRESPLPEVFEFDYFEK